MKKLQRSLLPITTICALGIAATAFGDHHEKDKDKMMKTDSVKELVAVMTPTEGNETTGTVNFSDVGDKVRITVMVSGLTPNAKHAIHVHEFGDAKASDGTSAGGHFNPEGHDHALPEKEMRHAGDFGNLEADEEGKAVMTIEVDNLTLIGHENSVVGRSVIIHAKEDDGGQPTGNAGPRIAQGIIGIANTSN